MQLENHFSHTNCNSSMVYAVVSACEHRNICYVISVNQRKLFQEFYKYLEWEQLKYYITAWGKSILYSLENEKKSVIRRFKLIVYMLLFSYSIFLKLVLIIFCLICVTPCSLVLLFLALIIPDLFFIKRSGKKNLKRNVL